MNERTIEAGRCKVPVMPSVGGETCKKTLVDQIDSRLTQQSYSFIIRGKNRKWTFIFKANVALIGLIVL